MILARLLVLTFLAALLLTVVFSANADAHNRPGLHNRLHAIHWAFCGKQTRRSCPLGGQAVRVAKCESGWSLTPWAHNGQFLGMFQMGAYARSRFGHSFTPWGQAAAAYRYYRAAGWSPWACRP